MDRADYAVFYSPQRCKNKIKKKTITYIQLEIVR